MQARSCRDEPSARDRRVTWAGCRSGCSRTHTPSEFDPAAEAAALEAFAADRARITAERDAERQRLAVIFEHVAATSVTRLAGAHDLAVAHSSDLTDDDWELIP